MTTTIIADDHDIVRRGLRGILESTGACKIVAEASDGLAAAQLTEKHRPGLLILDLNMPRLHGLEVLRQVKSDVNLKTIPVVVLTSSREEQDLLRTYDLGVNAYVVKPVSFPEFVQAVKVLGGFWAVINEPPPLPARP